jgi:hypothetical protein
MKTHLFIICITLFCTNLSFAQESGKWRGGLEGGDLYPHEGGFGFFLGAAEVKYNLQNNMNVGFKTEVTRFFKSKNYSAELLSFIHSTSCRMAIFCMCGLMCRVCFFRYNKLQ